MVLLHGGMFNKNIILLHLNIGGRNSAVGKANSYVVDGPDFESSLGESFSATSRSAPVAHPAPFTMRTWSFPGVKRPGRGADYESHLTPRLKKSRAINLLPLCTFVSSSGVNFIFKPKPGQTLVWSSWAAYPSSKDSKFLDTGSYEPG